MPRTLWSIPNSSHDALSTGPALSGGRMWLAVPIAAWAAGCILKSAGQSRCTCRRRGSRDESLVAVIGNHFDPDQPHAARREQPLAAELAPDAAKPIIGGEGRHPH